MLERYFFSALVGILLFPYLSVFLALTDFFFIHKLHSIQKIPLPKPLLDLPHILSYAKENDIDLATVPSLPPEKRGGSGSVAADVYDKVASKSLTCGTEKDDVDKGLRFATSAGILAVCWSCGIVIGVNELYGAGVADALLNGCSNPYECFLSM